MWAGQAERISVLSSMLGVGLVGALIVLAELPRGGVAPLVVAGGVALAVGAPAGLAEWRSTVPHELHAARESIGEVLGLALVAAALASVGAGTWLALVCSLAVWPTAAVLAARVRWASAALAAAGAALALLGALGSFTLPPWTLLEPQWGEWAAWGPSAVLGGLWFAGAGSGQWVNGPPRGVGVVRAPLAPVGAATLAATAVAVQQAAQHEASLGTSHGGPLTAAILLLLGGSAAAGFLARPAPPAPAPWIRPTVGAGLTLVLAWPATGATDVLTHAVLPWLGAATSGTAAFYGRGPDRAAAGAAAALFLLAALASGAPVPAAVDDALWLGVTIALAFWFVATRTLVAREVQ